MPEQILVPLKRDVRVEEVIPYIEDIARPGMMVVFLMRYPVEGHLAWLRDHWITAESVSAAVLAGKYILENYSPGRQEQLAKQRLFPACETLRTSGVDISLDLYAGRLKRVIRRYARQGDVYLIMMAASRSSAIMALVQKAIYFWSPFRGQSLSPMLLLHLNRGA